MFGRSGAKWYEGGLQFSCTQCGNCCSGPPGYVWVTKEDIRAIAAYLGREDGALDPAQVRRIRGRFSLTEKPGGDCIFLERRGSKAYCSIYPVRPVQCRTWPFWDELLKSRRAWDRGAENCPGMNHGPHYSFVAIEELRIRNRTEGV